MGIFAIDHDDDPREGPICGSTIESTRRLLDIDVDHGLRTRSPLPRPLMGFDAGDIAVIQDDGTIVLRGTGPIDLQGSTLVFQPTPDGGMDISFGDPPQNPTELGDPLGLGDDDSALVEFSGGFSFPFYGTDHDSVFVNSNGNLTFGGPAPFGGDPEEILRAFPRIVPLGTDLDPGAGGEIFVLQAGDHWRAMWRGVPEWGIGGSNSFFVTLWGDGRLEMGFLQLTAQFSPTGITPGGLRPGLTQVDFTADAPLADVRGAVFEVFFPVGSKLLDLASLTQNFYDTHADEYDTVVLWADFPFNIRAGFAFYQFIQNEVRGIGMRNLIGFDGPFDGSILFGSDGALKGFLNMNFIDLYPDDPHQPFLRTNNTLAIMGQETGHRFGSFVFFDRDPGPGVAPSHELLGRGLAHWSFLLDSEASDLEGNAWADLGGGNFQVTGATARFSQLDHYIIGIRPPEEVDDFWFIDDDPLFSGTISSFLTPSPFPPLDVIIDDAQDFGAPFELFTSNSSPRTFFLRTNPDTPQEVPSVVLWNSFDHTGENRQSLSVFSFFGPLPFFAAPGDPYLVEIDPSAPPQTNLFNQVTGSFDGRPVSVTGERVDVSIEDVIAAEGPRLPIAGVQPPEYRQAFILLTEQGQGPRPGSVEKLERIRAGWVERYHASTQGRGEVVTTLVPRGKPRIAVGSQKKDGNGVELLDTGGASITAFDPFPGSDSQGLSLAGGHLADGKDLLVAATGKGVSAEAAIFRPDGTPIRAGIFPFGEEFHHGLKIATGDLDGLGHDEIIAGMADRGTRIRVFDADGVFHGPGFDAFPEASPARGVHVAAGDLDGDGVAEIVAGAGRNHSPMVRVFDHSGNLLHEFLAFDPNFKGGVRVAVGDTEGDGRAEIFAAPASLGDPLIRVFDGDGNPTGLEIEPTVLLDAFDASNRVGLTIATADLDLDGMTELVVGTGKGLEPGIATFDSDGSLLRGGFLPASGSSSGGLEVAAGDF